MSEREPITAELRRVMNHTTMAGVPLVEIGEYEFGHRCDAIDAVHAGLERENAELRQRVAELDKRDDSMHIGGSITDELRKWMDRTTIRFDDRRYLLGTDEELTAIADRIDAVHAGLERENAELRERLAVLDNERGNMHIGSASVTITDELRKWGYGFCGDTHDVVNSIADRIDAEHESACAKAYGNGVMSVPIALDESQWVKLPVDADGEYIHIGDVMEWPDGRTFEVVGIGDGTLFYVESDDADHAEWTGASTKRHHHTPTVEDVLTEFGIDWEYEDNCEDRAALLAEYAAKLRLVEGEDA